MFGSFGWMELLLILIIVLIIFGAGKLPQLGEGIGKAIKGFKKSVHDAEAIEAEATTTQGETAQAEHTTPPVMTGGEARPAGQSGVAGQPTTPPQARAEEHTRQG